jgi:hypothetical protein
MEFTIKDPTLSESALAGATLALVDVSIHVSEGV